MLGIDDPWVTRGWKSTKDLFGYLVTGKTRSYIMSMSYGATLISTSAPVCIFLASWFIRNKGDVDVRL